VKQRIEDTGSLMVANTPDEFAAQIAAEFEVYKKVVARRSSSLTDAPGCFKPMPLRPARCRCRRPAALPLHRRAVDRGRPGR
jgi:hypothetical protein